MFAAATMAAAANVPTTAKKASIATPTLANATASLCVATTNAVATMAVAANAPTSVATA